MTANAIKAHQTLLERVNLEEGTVLPVNKPLGWTSFDVVNKLKRALQIKKIGHTGTLDPLATGLLLLCTGKKTKEVSHYQNLEKVYEGEIIIGKTTPSFDLETDFDSETTYSHITEQAILELTDTFTGYIDQVPPAYAAIKVKGERAYKKARQSQKVTLLPRKVFIKSFIITSVNTPHIKFKVTCGKGTYIRSLAHDFGKKLGVGAYLAALKRTRIGAYQLKDAYEVTNFDHTSLKRRLKEVLS
ncbi:MAG: tRNA pseudouridine(55) synthase TruB [Cytophagales bacterium]|nr:tRNA pseudouridine(55) synthase TruB [Cytophagales bacterium]